MRTYTFMDYILEMLVLVVFCGIYTAIDYFSPITDPVPFMWYMVLGWGCMSFARYAYRRIKNWGVVQ